MVDICLAHSSTHLHLVNCGIWYIGTAPADFPTRRDFTRRIFGYTGSLEVPYSPVPSLQMLISLK